MSIAFWFYGIAINCKLKRDLEDIMNRLLYLDELAKKIKTGGLQF